MWNILLLIKKFINYDGDKSATWQMDIQITVLPAWPALVDSVSNADRVALRYKLSNLLITIYK